MEFLDEIGGGGRCTRASNGISGRNNGFEIFSQKSKRIMKKFTRAGDGKLIFYFSWPKVRYTSTIQTDPKLQIIL
jgi:hypothetical protein